MADELVSESDACEGRSHLPKIKVLVADLHRAIADTSTAILNLSGFSAFPAYSVDEAVKVVREQAIDVAVLELLIGETDAIDAAERILAVRPYCLIIIWAGQSEPVLSWVHHEAEERFGGCVLLQKPVHPQDLIGLLRGEIVPREHSSEVATEDSLSGIELHEFLFRVRDCVLEMMEEQGRGKLGGEDCENVG